MSYETLILDKKDYIGTITLNRPDDLNTFSIPLAEELDKALIDFENDSDVRVVVIKGAGRAFCAGIDLKAMDGKSPLEYTKWVEKMEQTSITISKMGKPVIASAHKIAVANGVGVIASADLAIAEEGTKFGTTAINLGLFCMGPAVPLSRNVGKKKALELLLTGDLIDAREAERIGLINKVVPVGELEEETQRLAKRLTQKSPLALQLGKKSFYAMNDLEYEKAFELVNNHFSMLCTTEDAHEGVNAFFEKREANWKFK